MKLTASLIVPVAAATALLWTQPASAQMVCGKRAEIIKQLESKYGETRQSLGLQQGRGIVEIYASDETGSWTILVTDPRGTSCLLAAGESFEEAGDIVKSQTPA